MYKCSLFLCVLMFMFFCRAVLLLFWFVVGACCVFVRCFVLSIVWFSFPMCENFSCSDIFFFCFGLGC